MHNTKNTLYIMALILTLSLSLPAQAEVSGNLDLEYRLFQHPATLPTQSRNNASLSAEMEYYHKFENGDNLVFTPYARVDQHDDDRTHADIRELFWSTIADTWELRVGIRKIFWGVTESQHLVDIINQTDGVENPDGEDKLGQPMINYAYITDWGTFDVFVLPGFRERNFTSPDGRLWPFPPGVSLDSDHPQYESDKQERHVDYALRWVKSIDEWDIGISHFYGTSRDPGFVSLTPTTLAPKYAIIQQTGLEAQATLEDWLLKLELITRKGKLYTPLTPNPSNSRYTAITTGFERTYVGIMESVVDLGLVMEYSFDDRTVPAGQTELTLFDNDMAVGTRFTFNDTDSSDLLVLALIDLDGRGQGIQVEGSRRFKQNWKGSLQARFFSGVENDSLLYPIREDGHLQLDVQYYF